MKLLYTTFFSLIILSAVQAQSGFFKTYGSFSTEKAWGLCGNSDGGFCIVGETNGFGGTSKSMYAIRIDAVGDTLWTKRYGGSSEDVAESIMQTADGGFIICGETKSAGSGNQDVYLLKTASDGTIEWSRTIGGSANEVAYSVIQTSDLGYAALGYTASKGVAGAIYLLKTDAAGNVLWTKTYDGSQYDGGYSLIETADNGFAFTGVTQSFGAGSYDAFLIKTDSQGSIEWNKTYGGTDDDWGYCVRKTLDGGYVISGHTMSFGHGEYDVLLMKTDNSGNLEWSNTYGDTGEDVGWYVLQNADGSYVISGNTEILGFDHHGAMLLKTDVNGNQLWNKRYGENDPDALINSDVAVAVVSTNNGYVIAGNTTSFGAGDYDALLIRTDLNGGGTCFDSTFTLVSGSAAIISGTATYTISSGGTSSVLNTTAATATLSQNACNLVGVEKNDQFSFEVFPNPVTDILEISGLQNGPFTVELSDIQGNIVMKNSNMKTINVSGLSVGTYVLRVITLDNASAMKFVKE